MAAALSALVEIICVERIANAISMVLYIYAMYTLLSKIFRRKDITLTRNRVIRICILNTPVPPIAGYF